METKQLNSPFNSSFTSDDLLWKKSEVSFAGPTDFFRSPDERIKSFLEYLVEYSDEFDYGIQPKSYDSLGKKYGQFHKWKNVRSGFATTRAGKIFPIPKNRLVYWVLKTLKKYGGNTNSYFACWTSEDKLGLPNKMNFWLADYDAHHGQTQNSSSELDGLRKMEELLNKNNIPYLLTSSPGHYEDFFSNHNSPMTLEDCAASKWAHGVYLWIFVDAMEINELRKLEEFDKQFRKRTDCSTDKEVRLNRLPDWNIKLLNKETLEPIAANEDDYESLVRFATAAEPFLAEKKQTNEKLLSLFNKEQPIISVPTRTQRNKRTTPVPSGTGNTFYLVHKAISPITSDYKNGFLTLEDYKRECSSAAYNANKNRQKNTGYVSNTFSNSDKANILIERCRDYQSRTPTFCSKHSFSKKQDERLFKSFSCPSVKSIKRFIRKYDNNWYFANRSTLSKYLIWLRSTMIKFNGRISSFYEREQCKELGIYRNFISEFKKKFKHNLLVISSPSYYDKRIDFRGERIKGKCRQYLLKIPKEVKPRLHEIKKRKNNKNIYLALPREILNKKDNLRKRDKSYYENVEYLIENTENVGNSCLEIGSHT